MVGRRQLRAIQEYRNSRNAGQSIVARGPKCRARPVRPIGTAITDDSSSATLAQRDAVYIHTKLGTGPALPARFEGSNHGS